MGCFLGCFGDAKDRRNRKHRVHRASPQGKRKQVNNVQQQVALLSDQSIPETPPPTILNSGLQNKPREVERSSPSPKKRVTFNSEIITHELVSVIESTNSLHELDGTNSQKKEKEDLKPSSQSCSGSEDINSVVSSVGSYPSNHRYHNARDSDDETDGYGDSDLEDFDDEDYCDIDDDEDADCAMDCSEVWSESIIVSSAASRVENQSAKMIDKEVENLGIYNWLTDEEAKYETLGSRYHARDRRDYVNSVLNPVENISQWKSAKFKAETRVLKPQKENMTSCIEAPCIAFSAEPTFNQPSFDAKIKSDKWKNSNAVDASLANWMVSPDNIPSKNSRPILGALTVDELKQISVTSYPQKPFPSGSSDDMHIMVNTGTYWNYSDSTTNNYRMAIPNTIRNY